MARPDQAHVELRGFGWRHGPRRAWAIRDVDLRVERGERVLLLGPSGAGKSTLLAALAGLLPAESGEAEGSVYVDGGPTRVGLVLQDPESQLVMPRAGDDVAFGLENLGLDAARIWPRTDAALAAVGFPYPPQRLTQALSGGEQQRLAIAGILARDPWLLLLDEPTANLDPAGAAAVRACVERALADSATTLIVVEHRVEEWLPLIDRVVVLAPGGGLLADGSPKTIFAKHRVALAEAGVWVPGVTHPPRRAAVGGGEPLLSAEAVGHTFESAVQPALFEVDCLVYAGQLLAVTGPSGCGKSTLALALGGLIAPKTGVVRAARRLAGRDCARPPHRWRAKALAGRIGSVFQNPEHQFITGKVVEELALGPRRSGHTRAAIAARVDDLLTRLNLSHLANANPFTLSGGEQRRLSVATALAAGPPVLILDEPTFGQDLRTWRQLVALIGGLRDDGTAVVAVTHDGHFADALADHRLQLAPTFAAHR